MPQLDLTWYPSQLFWLCVTFFTLYFIVSKMIAPKIENILAKRQDKIDDYLMRASLTKEKAENSLEKYNKALKDATKQANESLEKTKIELEAEITNKQEELAERLQKQIFDGEQLIAKNKEAALVKVRDVSEELAKVVIDKIGITGVANENIKSAIKSLAKD